MTALDPRMADAMRLGARNGSAFQFMPRRRGARSTPSLLVSLAWAIGPSLIGGLLFMAVVGLCAGLVP